MLSLGCCCAWLMAAAVGVDGVEIHDIETIFDIGVLTSKLSAIPTETLLALHRDASP